jgi:putative transposase
MKKSKFSDEQVVKILAEADSQNTTVAKVASAHQISEQTIYTWRRKFRGLKVQDVGKMRELERENSELKAMLAEAQLELRAVGKLIQKNGWRP